MTRDLLDEIKTKWNIPYTLPMSVPWGKDDVVWLVGEVERLRAENASLHQRFDNACAALRLGMGHLKGFYPVPYKEAEVLATMQAAIDRMPRDERVDADDPEPFI